MDGELTRADLKWSDFWPEKFEPFNALWCVGFFYFVAFFVTDYLLEPIGWMARELDHPLTHELRHDLLLVIPAILDAALWSSALWSEGLNRARKRKRERRALEKMEAARKAEAAKKAATPRPEESAPAPARRPSHPPRQVERIYRPEDDERDMVRFVSPPVHAGPDWEPQRVPQRPARVVASPPKKSPVELGPGLTEQQWHTMTDAKELLRHAVVRIPLRHTCLMLTHLAEVLWLDWHRKLPKDWRPSLCLAVVRAWCFGQASLAEVSAAREEARAASLRVKPGRTRFTSPYPAFAAANAIRAAAVYPGFERIERNDLVSCEPALEFVEAFISARTHEDAKLHAATEARSWGDQQTAPVTRLYGTLAARERERRELVVRRKVSAYLADVIRQYVPYPSRRATDWQVRGSLVCAGDAVLALDGWRIMQAVPVPTKPRYPRGGWN